MTGSHLFFLPSIIHIIECMALTENPSSLLWPCWACKPEKASPVVSVGQPRPCGRQLDAMNSQWTVSVSSFWTADPFGTNCGFCEAQSRVQSDCRSFWRWLSFLGSSILSANWFGTNCGFLRSSISSADWLQVSVSLHWPCACVNPDCRSGLQCRAHTVTFTFTVTVILFTLTKFRRQNPSLLSHPAGGEKERKEICN